MANNCLITKLKSVVDNPDLLTINSLKITVRDGANLNDSRRITMQSGYGVSYKVIAHGDFYLGSAPNSSDYGKEYETSGEYSHNLTIYTTTGTGFIEVIPKNRIVRISFYNWTCYGIDTADLKYCSNLSGIFCGESSGGSTGKLSDLYSLDLTNIGFGGSSVVADLDSIPLHFANVKAVSFQRSSTISGNVERFVENLPVRSNDSIVDLTLYESPNCKFNNGTIPSAMKLKYVSDGIEVYNNYLSTKYAKYTRGAANPWQYF